MARVAFPGPGENAKAIALPGRNLYVHSIMHALALEIDETLRQLDPQTAARFERLVRDAAALARPADSALSAPSRRDWLAHLERLRASLGSGKNASTTESILNELRDGR